MSCGCDLQPSLFGRDPSLEQFAALDTDLAFERLGEVWMRIDCFLVLFEGVVWLNC